MGPFIFERYSKDATITFKGNPDYWKAADVQIPKWVLAIMPDAQVRVQKIKKNKCQAMTASPLDRIAELEAAPRLRALGKKDFSIQIPAYNVQHSPLGDVRVRRALDGIIDKN